jgi:hypothetical protein
MGDAERLAQVRGPEVGRCREVEDLQGGTVEAAKPSMEKHHRGT